MRIQAQVQTLTPTATGTVRLLKLQRLQPLTIMIHTAIDMVPLPYRQAVEDVTVERAGRVDMEAFTTVTAHRQVSKPLRNNHNLKTITEELQMSRRRCVHLDDQLLLTLRQAEDTGQIVVMEAGLVIVGGALSIDEVQSDSIRTPLLR
jgi:hypothetical protein